MIFLLTLLYLKMTYLHLWFPFLLLHLLFHLIPLLHHLEDLLGSLNNLSGYQTMLPDLQLALFYIPWRLLYHITCPLPIRNTYRFFLLFLNQLPTKKQPQMLDGWKLCNLNCRLSKITIHETWFLFLKVKFQLVVDGSIK